MFGKEAARKSVCMCVYIRIANKQTKKREFEIRVSINVADCKQRKGTKMWNVLSKNSMNIPTKSKNHPEMKLVTLIMTKNHS